MAEAAEIARAAALAAPTAGRPLAAANAALSWPDPPHLSSGTPRPCCANTAATVTWPRCSPPVSIRSSHSCSSPADIAMDADWMRTRRGWTEDEWTAGVDRLTGRGLWARTGR